MTNKELTIEEFDPLDISGAVNIVYAVPGSERKDGVPHVLLYSGVGSGYPERAYHGRWLRLGSLAAKAVGSEAVEVIESHKGLILSLLATYQGTEWDGNNHVGVWKRPDNDDDFDIEYMCYDIDRDLSQVATYWEASDWFAPVGLQECSSCDLLEDQVNYELDIAADNDAHLDPGGVRDHLIYLAEKFLEEDSEEDEAELKTRVLGWIKQNGEI